MTDRAPTGADQTWLRDHFSEALGDLRAIAARGPTGLPSVVEVSPLRTEKPGRRTPCPTHWWLVDPDAKRRVSHLESAGWIGRFENRLAEDAEALQQYHADHRRYAAARMGVLTTEEMLFLEAQGWREHLESVGVGGIRNPDAIKCLHLHYAHHLVQGCLLGTWIEAELATQEP